MVQASPPDSSCRTNWRMPFVTWRAPRRGINRSISGARRWTRGRFGIDHRRLGGIKGVISMLTYAQLTPNQVLVCIRLAGGYRRGRKCAAVLNWRRRSSRARQSGSGGDVAAELDI